eukprot:TRINITY_DN943_c0_g2::TRINITY_DN943_c0_g2_i1::g.15965::m.15965 TRINITY_DN943_c0_g2::TRINITY_DN943_c0_g2_i1::g.15965  ORF type:complete len:191 (+),score=-17.89,TMEM125/PF15109.1/81,TMEM125/PF15109.1/43,TMEM125/PF15109.1/23 TRINITY_DN943_c0_g2_i1:65-574(+)
MVSSVASTFSTSWKKQPSLWAFRATVSVVLSLSVQSRPLASMESSERVSTKSTSHWPIGVPDPREVRILDVNPVPDARSVKMLSVGSVVELLLVLSVPEEPLPEPVPVSVPSSSLSLLSVVLVVVALVDNANKCIGCFPHRRRRHTNQSIRGLDHNLPKCIIAIRVCGS